MKNCAKIVTINLQSHHPSPRSHSRQAHGPLKSDSSYKTQLSEKLIQFWVGSRRWDLDETEIDEDNELDENESENLDDEIED